MSISKFYVGLIWRTHNGPIRPDRMLIFHNTFPRINGFGVGPFKRPIHAQQWQ